MKKSFSMMHLVIILCLISFVSILTFVSILGENSKAENIVKAYFTAIHEQNFNDTMLISSEELRKDRFTNLEETYNFSFLFELSLLEKFNLLHSQDYRVSTLKNDLWLPFSGNNKLLIGLFLEEKKTRSITELFHFPDKSNYLIDVIEVVRENGDWKINRFITDNPDLKNIYSKFSTQLDLDSYIQKTNNGFIVKNAEIDLIKTSDVHKRLFKFSLFKINTVMNIEKKDDDDGLLEWLN